MDEEKGLSEDEIANILQRVGPLQSPPDEMTARVKTSVKQVWQQEVTARSRSWLYRAAAAVAVVSIGLLFMLQQPALPAQIAHIDSNEQQLALSMDNISWHSTDTENISEGQFLWANGTDPISITMDHGMNVRAKPGTTLQFVSRSQVTLLTGSIYLDSYDKSKDIPFEVQTPFGRVRDIGTQFMVTLDDAMWSVQVREGFVNLSDDTNHLVVTSGEVVTISATDELSKHNISSHDLSWQWTEQTRPGYDIEGKHLDEYLDWVARETGKQLHYGSDKSHQIASSTALHGSIDHFSASESLDQVLKSVDMKLIESTENVIIVDFITR